VILERILNDPLNGYGYGLAPTETGKPATTLELVTR
jgi:hypothetical protein